MLRRCRPLLGTYVEVTAESTASIDAGFAAIERVHMLMSAHEPDSDVSRINRFAHLRPIEVSGETRAVLERSLRWWRRSGGLFDIAAAGSRALQRGLIPRHAGQPRPEASESAVLSLSGNEVSLSAPACVDLGGSAKGFAVDRAAAAMRAAGASLGLVNAGGDLFGFGPRPWPVTVVDPVSRKASVEMEIRDEALATSALVDGSAAHLRGRAWWTSVSVRAPSARDADALTKIVWAGCGDLLASAGASAFGMRGDGKVEEIGKRADAA